MHHSHLAVEEAVHIAGEGHCRVVEVGIGLAVGLRRGAVAGEGSLVEAGKDYAVVHRRVAAAEEGIPGVGNLVVGEDSPAEVRVNGLLVRAGEGNHPVVDILVEEGIVLVEGTGPAEAVGIPLEEDMVDSHLEVGRMTSFPTKVESKMR
jgi:hypothetical protein